jgi:hypothetical protein
MVGAPRNVSTQLDPTTALVMWATNCMPGMTASVGCTYYMITFTEE